MKRIPIQFIGVTALIVPLLVLSGCTRAKSQITECSYEVDKLFVHQNVPSDWAERLQRDLKIGELISKCMKARGFQFNAARAIERHAKKQYSGHLEWVMDDRNWDPWWLAKLTHKEPR